MLNEKNSIVSYTDWTVILMLSVIIGMPLSPLPLSPSQKLWQLLHMCVERSHHIAAIVSNRCEGLPSADPPFFHWLLYKCTNRQCGVRVNHLLQVQQFVFSLVVLRVEVTGADSQEGCCKPLFSPNIQPCSNSACCGQLFLICSFSSLYILSIKFEIFCLFGTLNFVSIFAIMAMNSSSSTNRAGSPVRPIHCAIPSSLVCCSGESLYLPVPKKSWALVVGLSIFLGWTCFTGALSWI